MKQYDFIGIDETAIFGVKNPLFTIRGTIEEKEAEFFVEADGKCIPHEHVATGVQTSFIITAALPKNVKNVEVYVRRRQGGKKHLVYTGKTSLLKRVLKRTVQEVRRCFKKIGRVFYVIGRGLRFLWKEYHFLVPFSLWPKYYNDFKASIKRGSNQFYNPLHETDYRKWLSQQKVEAKTDLSYQPLISILTPVYNVSRELLSACIDSVLHQSYQNFELILVDDASTKKETLDTLREYEAKEPQIKVSYRKENGHISKTTNDALKIASGDFIALLDNDDVLAEDALYYMVEALNKDKNLDFIYSDEDKLNLKGERCEPHFKPDWSPDTLLSLNYICHFTMIRKSLVLKVGGFEVGLEGAQDYDLFLKVTEQTKNIYHVPKILYHWRKTKTSTAQSGKNKDYASDKGILALEHALSRRGIKGKVQQDKLSGYYRICYENKKEPLISIIIPTRDYVAILKTCVDSIYKKTTYRNFEVIIANNDSKEQATLDFFKSYQKKYKNFKVVDCIMNFNYSRINNIAVSKAKGEYIVLLNNDTEIISPDWLDVMVGYAMQEHIGIVGPKLLYPDGTIQHAGVLLGLGGVASHAYIGARNDETGLYGRLQVPYNYSACTAACFMIKKEIYEKISGLNETLEVAYNDIDFCIRVLKEGYYNVVVPQVQLMHYESKSRGLDTTTEKYKRFLIESDYMYEHWTKEIENDIYYNPNFSKKGWFMLDKK